MTITLAEELARLTDAQPPISPIVAAPPVKKICAWCPDHDPTDPINQHATHGICPTCARRFWKEIR